MSRIQAFTSSRPAAPAALAAERVSPGGGPGAARAGGLEEGFEQLYRQHAPRLYALAVRMSGSSSEGEDLLQEIFIQAFRKLDTFRGDAAVGTWLYRLAVNCCVDHLRSRRARMARLSTAFEEYDFRGPGDATPERLDLERAIRELPDRCREVFVLHDVEGFSHAEIATLLGIAEGTSKAQTFKARLRLRAILR